MRKIALKKKDLAIREKRKVSNKKLTMRGKAWLNILWNI
jgi:hypothetical protein